MAKNNTITLIGFTGKDVKVIENEGKSFAALSLATTDSYKDKETGEWKDKKTEWHDILAFSPKLIEQLKDYKKGTKLKVTGSLSYREFQVQDEGKVIKKQEASIIASNVEDASAEKVQEAA